MPPPARIPADSADLVCISIPGTVTDIAEDAFSGCERLTIICLEGSAAMTTRF